MCPTLGSLWSGEALSLGAAAVDNGDVRRAVGVAQLLKGEVGVDTAVHHQHRPVEYGGEGKPREEPLVHVVDGQPVLVDAFLPEAVDGVAGGLLMVAPVEEDGPGVQLLEREDGEGHLYSLIAAVHKVTVEEIWLLKRGKAVHVEDVHEVCVLPVNVANDADLLTRGNLELHDVWKRMQ